MLLADFEIQARCKKPLPSESMIYPYVPDKNYMGHLSYGQTSFGYDVRIGAEVKEYMSPAGPTFTQLVSPADDREMNLNLLSLPAEGYTLEPGKFALFSTLEHFNLPKDICGIVRDKSTLARLGLAVQNTVMEPGWRGFLTMEISNHGNMAIQFRNEMPIAQIQFFRGAVPAAAYEGRYQDQMGTQEPMEKRNG